MFADNPWLAWLGVALILVAVEAATVDFVVPHARRRCARRRPSPRRSARRSRARSSSPSSSPSACCSSCAPGSSASSWSPTPLHGSARRPVGRSAVASSTGSPPRRPRQARAARPGRAHAGDSIEPGDEVVVDAIDGATAVVSRAASGCADPPSEAGHRRSSPASRGGSETGSRRGPGTHRPAAPGRLCADRALPHGAHRAAADRADHRAARPLLAHPRGRHPLPGAVRRQGARQRRPARAGRLLPAAAGDHLRQPRRQHRHGHLLLGHRRQVGRLRDRQLHPGHRAAHGHHPAQRHRLARPRADADQPRPDQRPAARRPRRGHRQVGHPRQPRRAQGHRPAARRCRSRWRSR